MSAARAPRRAARRHAAGVTLVELMVAMVLGLIVAGAAMAVFLTNRQTYVATESLGRLQEGSRIAFELMSRDLRAAGTIPCSDESTFTNVVAAGNWWSDWDGLDGGLRGYASTDAAFATGSAAGDRVANDDAALFAPGWTDAVESLQAVPPGVDPVVVATEASSEEVPLTLDVNSTSGIATGDLLMGCDYGFNDDSTGTRRGPAATIFQATDASGTQITVAASGSPGNVAGDFLSSSAPNTLQPNGLLSVLHATRWYIGHNPVGGTSLYRAALRNNAGTLAAPGEEIVRGADGLSLAYLEDGADSYVDASAVGDWGQVVAIRVRLHLTGEDRVDGEQVERTVEHVIAIRNRVQ